MLDKSCTFQFNNVEESEVKKLLKSLPEHSSVGTDMDSKVLSLAVDYVCGPLCQILNACLMKGVFPTIWKEGKIIPLPKDGRLALTGKNSRPITILPVLSKLMERIVHSQVKEYFESNGLNTDVHNAYRQNHSTCSALTVMTDDWLKERDNLKMTGAVLLDFSAAFDVIDHNLLIGKLECYGFSPTAIDFMKSYLTCRTQRVYYTGSWSHSKVLNCGVPQGSCLGPLLYAIFTNDLPSVLCKATVQMYADDSILHYAAKTVSELD